MGVLSEQVVPIFSGFCRPWEGVRFLSGLLLLVNPVLEHSEFFRTEVGALPAHHRDVERQFLRGCRQGLDSFFEEWLERLAYGILVAPFPEVSNLTSECGILRFPVEDRVRLVELVGRLLAPPLAG